MSQSTPDLPPKRTPKNRRGVIVGIALVLLVLDFGAGPSINFPVFYVFPVMLAAWQFDFRTAALVGIGMTLARFGFQWHEGFQQGGLEKAAINNVMRAIALALVAWLTEMTARQDRVLRARVEKLESLLPLCPACDTMRGEDGRWRPLDDQVGTHAKPRVACPVCAEKEERL